MTQVPCVYDDRVRLHPYHSSIPGTESVRRASGSRSYSLPFTTPQFDAAYRCDYSQLPLPSVPHHEFDFPSQIMPPSYPPFPVCSESLSDPSPTYGNQGVPHHSGLYSAWNSFYTSPDPPPNNNCDISIPTPYHTTLDPPYAETLNRQSSWPTGDARVGSVGGAVLALTDHEFLTFPLANSESATSSHPDLDNLSETYSGSLDASYHCQWVTGGVICNAVVQATRSQMNRHLHAYHGFGGSDTRQTKCNWAGCEATMQQGSIARHMVTCHLQAKVTCPMCSKKLSRQDVISKHQRVCPAALAGTWR